MSNEFNKNLLLREIFELALLTELFNFSSCHKFKIFEFSLDFLLSRRLLLEKSSFFTTFRYLAVLLACLKGRSSC